LIRVVEGGEITDERPSGGDILYACMLGGDDGRTLFACAAPTSHEDEASAHHRAAILFTTVDVPHGGLP
jgi:hypothetical protein